MRHKPLRTCSRSGNKARSIYSSKRFSEHSGTGLGLAIVHGVVKEHDGYLDVVSAEGGGTVFALYLPRVPERDIALESSVRPKGDKARILVVDDSQIQLRTARRVLAHFGFSVEVLSSGAQAYERFREHTAARDRPYDLVILDMLLNEERDGLEILHAIRGLFPDQPAIPVTGHAPNERVAAATTQGLVWLAKPYKSDELAQAVQTTLEASSTVSTTRP